MALRKTGGTYVRLDRPRVIDSFRRALDELRDGVGVGKLSPRGVALKAHFFYGLSGSPEEGKPSWYSFQRLVTGRGARREILALLEANRVVKRTRAELDRGRVLLSFQRAIGDLMGVEAKSVRIRPLHVAQRAHEIYSKLSGVGARVPSDFTFQRLAGR